MNKISIYINSVLLVIVCLFMMTGCVEEYEADLPDSETHLLVVSGTICSNELNEFYLTWSSPIKTAPSYLGYKIYSDETPLPVTSAKVTICGTDGTEYQCTQSGNEAGKYTCILPELNPDVSYFVNIECAGDVYQANPESPIRTPDIDSLEYFQKDRYADIEVLMTTAAPEDSTKTNYFTWDYTETWELRPDRVVRSYFDKNGFDFVTEYVKELYPRYGWKIEDSDSIFIESTTHYAGGKLSKYQLVSIPSNDERILWNYCNDVKLRAISKAEFEYEMACRQAGWEMGGLFTPQPSALPTNIRCLTSSNRVIGYVGCALNVVNKRLYIDGTKISRILPDPYVRILYSASKYDALSESYNMLREGLLLSTYSESLNGPFETHWLEKKYIDIRSIPGVITVQPDYMPPFGEKYNFEDNAYKLNDYNDEEEDINGDETDYYDGDYYYDYYDTYSKSRRRHRD